MSAATSRPHGIGRAIPVDRTMAAVAALVGALYIAFYLSLMAHQGTVWDGAWYATAVAVPVVLCSVAAATGRVRVLAAVAAVLFGVLTVLALMTIGLLLVPALVCAIIGASTVHASR